MAFVSLGSGLGFRQAEISSVVTAAESYDLIALDVLKADLGITGTSENVFLSSQIARASKTIADHCNNPFVIEARKDEFFPTRDLPLNTVSGGSNVISLRRWPALKSPAIVVKLAGDTLTEGADYKVDYEQGLIYRLDTNGYPVQWGSGAVVVEYSAGYAAIPADVIGACEQVVKGRYLARDRDPTVHSEFLTGVYSVKYFGDPKGGAASVLSADVLAVLDKYRIPVVS